MRTYLSIAIVVATLLAYGCSDKRSSQDTLLEARLARLNSSLADENSKDANKPIARWHLPPELAEISGLALTPDGRLFAHNDETARISEIDYRRGIVVKQFMVQETGDFEGLTYADDHFILLTSNGVLLQFPEGANGERVDCTTLDTRLGKECEFEGIVYDSRTNAVVLSCKIASDKKLRDSLILYRYPLDVDAAEPSMQTIPYSEVIGKNNWEKLRPTDLTIDPASGNYVLVAAQEHALVAFTPDGDGVLARSLGNRHQQPEGVAVTRDHILIVSDEATNTAATLTLYRWP